MSGFWMTPMTRFYAEVVQNMNETAAGKPGGGKTGQTGVCTAGRRAVQTGADTVAGKNSQAVSDGQAKSTGFADAVNEKIAQREGTAPGAAVQNTGRNEAAVQAMSRSEYKLYIYQKIAAIPMNPSQKQDMVSVNISEEGLAAMQADPAYEKWVLDTLRKDFGAYNPWSSYVGGSYRSHYFGATRQEYKGESLAMGVRKKSRRTKSYKKKEKSYWDKRAERHKLYMDLKQKAWYKHENEQHYQQQIDFQRREVSSALLRQWAMERATGEEEELDVNPSVLSQAATDYAQGYVFFKIPSALVNPRPKTFR